MNPTVLWSVELGLAPSGPMLAVGDLLLVSTQEAEQPAQRSALHARSRADGSLRWQQPFEYALVSGLETCEASKTSQVLVATHSTDVMRGEGMLLALDLLGQQRWRWAPGVQRVSAPAVVGNLVCVTADAETLVALDLASGKEQVKAELPESASLAATAMVSDVAFVPCRGPHLLAVGLDGKLRWRFDIQDAPDVWLDKTPAVAGERVFAVLNTGAVVALQTRDGMLLWRVDVGPTGKRLSAPATDGTRLYVGARDGLRALDLDGREVWTLPTARQIEAAPVIVGSVVYAGCCDHNLYALDPATGRELWRHQAGQHIEIPPVVAAIGEPAKECVIVADNGGTLSALERPLTAEEYQAAGRWAEAASGYAGLGQFARGAELLEAHDEPLKAAELWKAAGELERAAAQFQAALAWQQAAETWSALGQPLKQAEALEQHARSLDASQRGDQERAAAWDAAAQAFQTEGAVERALACGCEAARLRRLPLIQVQVQAPETMLLGEYHEIAFELTNVGGGAARQVILRHTKSEFAGDLQASRQIRNVPPGQSVTEILSLRALAAGTVPLDVSVTYTDSAGQPCEVRQRALLNVRRPEPAPIAILWGPEGRKMQEAQWLDLEIRIFERKEQSYPVEITLEGEQEFRGSLSAKIASWAATGVPAEDGRRLFEALFADGNLRGAWAEARGQLSRRRIRLRIDPAAAELHPLPWELLQEGQVMLAAHADTPFSRYLPISLAWGEPITARPIRALVAISNPSDLQSKHDLPPVDMDLERRTLEDVLASMDKGDLQVDFLEAPVTLERLEEALRRGYHVLHFLGHGAFNAKSQQAALYLQDEKGAAQRARDDQLAGMLARQGVQPRLVFLAACQSATRSTADAFLGLGPKLVSIGVPAVVAMQDVVTVETARKLGAMFYRRLLGHGQVDLATNEARSTLLTAGRLDAAVPVLFMRLRSGQLWAEEESEAAQAQPALAPKSKPSAASGWNTSAIRDMLTAAFSDEELTTLCFDHFRPVYEDFTGGMSKGQKIQRLLDHCERHDQAAELLALARDRNPAQYGRFEQRLRG